MSQRGIAMPTALIALSILTVLLVAFVALASMEPLIGENHVKAARARGIAEAGLERAIWALNLEDLDALAGSAPYNGSVYFTVGGLGGFTLRITGAGTQRDIIAVGWTPDQSASAGVRRIETRLVQVKVPDPRCGICSLGELDVTGNATIDARDSSRHCPGLPPLAGTMTHGDTDVSGSGDVYGPDGNNTPDQEPGDILDNVPTTNFDFLIDRPTFEVLRDLAKAAGTYYQGSVTFNNSNPPPNGIVVVDTTTGAEYTQSTPDSEAASVVVDGNITWGGWLIVAGRLDVRGNVSLTGLLYAYNEMVLTGNGTIAGAAVSENRKDSVASVVSIATGSEVLNYDCHAVRDGGGQVPRGWVIRPGTYREVAGT